MCLSLVGVYFTSCVETVKFVDFCGKYRVPLLQYLCSPRCRPQPQPQPRSRAELQRQFSGSAGSESQAAGASGASGASADVAMANASSSSIAGPAPSEFSGLSTDSETEFTSPESKEPALSEAARSAQEEEQLSDRVRKVLLPF